ncbi:hypothetical protein Gpo141_00001964 [Globisporangium polare]
MATRSLHVSCSTTGGEEIDEARLLAETEELLMSLEPIAFVDATDMQRSSTSASTPCSSKNSDRSSSSDSQSAHQNEVAPVVGPRKRAPKPGAVRNPSRERLQNELASLRKQVLTLESDLHTAQELQAAASVKNKVVVVSMWERVAKRQMAVCERSMKENKRLKSMLKLQKEMVVSMEESLYNWQHVATLPPVLLDSLGEVLPRKNVHLEPGDDLLFAMLVSELDATYLKVDEVFYEAGLHQEYIAPYTRTTPKTLVASDGSQRSLFELTEVEFLPFDYQMVSRVGRICGEMQSQSPDCVVFQGDWDPESVITEKHRVKRVYNGVKIYFHMLMALKEYDFEDQMVCVWRSVFKCEEQFPDAYVQEMGWLTTTNMVSQDSSNSDSGAPPIGSLSKMCVHLESKRFTAPSASIKVEADTMATLVMNNYHDDMEEMNDMLESLLIQESLEQGSSSKAAVAG